MPDMTPQEMEEYLSGKHIAHLSSLNPDGSPHVIPIWYRYADSKLYMAGGNSGAKARNIRRDSRVVVSITGPEQPYKYVLVHGTARIVTEEIEQLILAVTTRYMGQKDGAEFAKELMERSSAGVIIVNPTKIISRQFDRVYY